MTKGESDFGRWCCRREDTRFLWYFWFARFGTTFGRLIRSRESHELTMLSENNTRSEWSAWDTQAIGAHHTWEQKFGKRRDIFAGLSSHRVRCRGDFAGKNEQRHHTTKLKLERIVVENFLYLRHQANLTLWRKTGKKGSELEGLAISLMSRVTASWCLIPHSG